MNIGRKYSVIAKTETTPWDESEQSQSLEIGSIYIVENIIGYGIDLVLTSGSGPKEVRIMESNLNQYFKLVE